MARTVPAVTNRMWQPGPRDFGPAPINAGEYKLVARIDRADFASPAMVLEVWIELSLNGQNGDYDQIDYFRLTGEPTNPDGTTEIWSNSTLIGWNDPGLDRWARGRWELSEQTKLGLNLWIMDQTEFAALEASGVFEPGQPLP